MWRFITMQSIPARCMCWPSGIKKKQATDNYCNLNIPTIQFRQEIGRTAGNVSEVVTEVRGIPGDITPIAPAFSDDRASLNEDACLPVFQVETQSLHRLPDDRFVSSCECLAPFFRLSPRYTLPSYRPSQAVFFLEPADRFLPSDSDSGRWTTCIHRVLLSSGPLPGCVQHSVPRQVDVFHQVRMN